LPAGTVTLTDYKIQEQQQAEVYPSPLYYNKIQEQQQAEVYPIPLYYNKIQEQQ
jgi:hypothetical protein